MNKLVYLGISRLELSKILMYEFWYDYVRPKNSEKKQNYIIWRQTVSLYTLKVMILMKTLQKMLKLDLITEIINLIDHCLK